MFRLIHLDGLGIKSVMAYTLSEACDLAGWDMMDVDYEIILPIDLRDKNDPRQLSLPGLKPHGFIYD
jgi:hypothetical protein